MKELTEKKEKCQEVYDLFTTSYNELKEKLITYDKINEYDNKLIDINIELNKVEFKSSGIHTINEKQLLDLDQKIERLEQLNELLYKIKKV